MAYLLPDFGDVTDGAGGDRARLFVERMGPTLNPVGGGLDGLDGLMGGVIIFLMISLVFNLLRAAAAVALTGGGALLNTLILFGWLVIDRRLQNRKRKASIATDAITDRPTNRRCSGLAPANQKNSTSGSNDGRNCNEERRDGHAVAARTGRVTHRIERS